MEFLSGLNSGNWIELVDFLSKKVLFCVPITVYQVYLPVLFYVFFLSLFISHSFLTGFFLAAPRIVVRWESCHVWNGDKRIEKNGRKGAPSPKKKTNREDEEEQKADWRTRANGEIRVDLLWDQRSEQGIKSMQEHGMLQRVRDCYV